MEEQGMPTGKKTTKKKRLGKGLSSMIAKPVAVAVAGSKSASTVDTAIQEPSSGGPGLRVLPVGDIRPNRHQPRQDFDQAALETLSESIKTSGLMQPVVVRADGSAFELVVGERRWRAAQMAGLTEIPAVVRDLDDRTSAEWALVENLQREDLNPIERAEAFVGLQDEFGLTHQEIADQVGLTRSAVTNQIRLNDLDDGTRELVRTGSISAGHGRALLAVANLKKRLQLARDAMRGEWSVRALEARVQESTGSPESKPSSASKSGVATQHEELARQLGEHLGTRVRIREGRKKGSGHLVIEFYSLDQFDGLMSRLDFKQEG
ncbi:MAG: chromosome partitioning protein ParB [Phycisphaerae bacterium]|nr:chromosome partitioning protein ParB [Phycisphaerae bacterium]